MSEQDPKRLLEGGASQGAGDLRSLLEAGKSEMPSDEQMMMLAAKLGAMGGMGGAGAAGAGGGAGAGAGGGAGAGAGATVKAGIAIKVIGAVAIAAVAGAGAVAVSQKGSETKPPVGLVAVAAADANANANANGNGNVSASASASADADTKADAGTAKSGAKIGRASATNVASAEVRDEGPEAEVKLLERAQDALRSRPDEALALCNDHAQRFPSGMLVQEREVIAIEALVKTGRKEEARTRADRFKARFPGSSHTRRLDALLGG
jgi:hypothetical protein